MKNALAKNLMIIFLILCLLTLYAALLFDKGKSTTFSATEGVLDLSSWDSAAEGLAILSGEWRYYPDRLAEDIDKTDEVRYKEVPHYWEEDASLTSATGFATYVLTVKGLAPDQIYGMEILDEVMSYTIEVNGSSVAKNGVVAKEKNAYTPEWKPKAVLFQSDEIGTAMIVVEIANFDYYRGGFWNSIKIGDPATIEGYFQKEKGRDFFPFLVIFLIGLFNIGLFWAYRKSRISLYFSLFCFSVSTYIVLTGQRILFDVISYYNWKLFIRLEYLSGFLLLPFFALFILSLLEREERKSLLERVFQVGALLMTLITLFSPGWLYCSLLQPYKYATLFLAAYFLCLTYRGIRKKRIGAGLMLFAIGGMGIALVREVFIGGPISWVPLASLNFVICFSIITLQLVLEMIKRTETLELKVILDPLTGLYNRSFLLDSQYGENLENQSQARYLFFLDLDRFKSINDSYGHKIGDYVLVEAGKRLKDIVKDTDLVCRYGGDEFIIVVEGDEKEEMMHKGEAMIDALRRPFPLDGKSYYVGASIGVTKIDYSDIDIESSIKRSDDAMYLAKKAGGNQVQFSSK